MINNLLKVVGVESGGSRSSPGTYSSPGASKSNDRYTSTSPPPSAGASTTSAASAASSLLGSSTIGGFLNNFNNGTAMVAGALDSAGVVGHKSWGNYKGSKGHEGAGGGRHRNAGGRGYYSDGSRGGRDPPHPIALPGGSGDPPRGGRGARKGKGGGGGGGTAGGTYRGRRMVADVDRLYQVVDDRQAYDNYDTLMEIASNASTQASERLANEADHSEGSGGRRGRRSRGSSQEQKQNWARAKEEELIDRMLSQFPEFGTNRPTPFTVRDSDEEDDNDDDNSLFQSGKNATNVFPKGGAAAPPTAVGAGRGSASVSASNANPNSPSRFLTDDASDILGRFFFGVPGSSNNSSAAASTKAGAAGGATGAPQPEDFKRTASFGSTSSMSTMTSATGGAGRAAAVAAGGAEAGSVGRIGGNVTVGLAQGPADQQRAHREADPAGGELGKDEVWDQDEIDLWTAPPQITAPENSGGETVPGTVYYDAESSATGTRTGAAATTQQNDSLSSSSYRGRQRSNKEESAHEQQQQNGDGDTWASRRKRHRERRKKRQDWEALKNHPPSSSVISNSHVILTDPSAGTMPGAGGPTSNLDPHPFHPQRTLLTALQPGLPASANKGPPQETTMSNKQNKAKGGGGGGSVIVDDSKQHWMPDKLCKHCYSCEAPFTLIRRKHHCRVCGMIFCNACSAYFVRISSQDDAVGPVTDGKSAGKRDGANQGTMRTCKMCYDHLSERGLGVIMRGGGPGGTAAADSAKLDGGSSSGGGGGGSQPSSSSEVLNAKKQSPALGVDNAEATVLMSRKGSARDILLPLAGHDERVPTAIEEGDATAAATSASKLTDQFAGFQVSGGGAMSGDFHALSITRQRLDEEGQRREEQERREAEAAAALEEEAAAAALADGKVKSSAAGGGSGRSSFLAKSRTSLRQLKWKGGSSSNLNESKDSSAETINAGSNAVEVSVGDAAAAEAAVCTACSTVENNSGIEGALFGPGQSKDAKSAARIHLGTVAADHLEKLGRALLETDAPLLLEEITKACAAAGASAPAIVESKLTDLWVNIMMTLATRCCATVEPDVKNGDLLDIRPYCKLKVIPGGSVEDSAYMSGVVFHKNVSHKKMARIIPNAKIMMLSGGIEYTRTENRIASLDTLLEQEERYMEILVTKIFKLKPDVLIVGKSVCRKAQELLLRANISLVQYVKSTLMTRIARQTGATVLSSIDHVMTNSILGSCRRFRLVSFRDNDIWVDDDMSSRAVISSDQKSVPLLLSQNIPNHERQAALAARKLGEGVLDGMDAVTSGLAKRGVVKTYVMIEGCPKELGCTVVLRGASRPALKQVKRVLSFLINCCYNMKLETSYILERCCRLPPSYKIPQTPCCSSSLCVDFGQPPSNRKARPWNGGKNDPAQRSLSGKITPLDHQAILITSVWMTDKTQCCPAEVKGICYYSMQDVSLGQFLRDSCFNLSLKCQNPSCKKSVLDHSLSFIHNDGLINISVERMDNPIPTSGLAQNQQQKDVAESSTSASTSNKQEETPSLPDYEPIATWTYCTKCNQVVTPLIFLSKQTWQWSFGKFLEVFFYNRDAIINAPGHSCSCRMQSASQLFFGCGNLAARFTYEKIMPYSVFCRRHLPFDEIFHRAHSLQDLEHISTTSSSLFVKYSKQIEAISRETRDLFGSAMNKPEHLQAVLSELNLVSAEVENASKVLREKISSVTAKYSKVAMDSGSGKSREYNEALFNFPWYSRRYLFMLASAWNERLSASGQALSAMKKIQHAGGSGRGDSAVVPTIVGDASGEDVIEGMKRIRTLQETYSRNYNVAKMTLPRSHKGETGGLFEGNILPDGRVATLEQEAEIDDEDFYSDPDNEEIDFEDDIDADVLASRNRVYSPQSSSSKRSSRQRPKKVLGGKRSAEMVEELPTIPDKSPGPLAFANNYDSTGQLETQGKSKTVTSAGGAVKSAITRFFNRGSTKEDPYVVDLGFFGKGRPRLPPGIGGLVIPVFDDQPSTIIAHSLASSDYDVQFKQFLNSTSSQQSESSRSSSEPPSRKDIERRMLGRNKSHIKHTFRDFDEKGQQLCKFVCTTFWSVQFNAVRQAFMNPHVSSKDSSSSGGGDAGGGSGSTKSSSGSNRLDIERSYIRSLAASFAWAASGGKSGAAFSRTTDDRFVIKCISRTELQMFLDCAPAYFEYLSKAFFHGLPTVLCKIVGVYQIGYHNRVTGKRTMEQVAVMQNIFFGRKISKIFDLKGSLRGRFTRQGNAEKEKKSSKKSSSKQYKRSKSENTTSDEDSFSSSNEDDDDTLSTSSGGIEKEEKASSNNAEKGEKAEKSESIPTLLDGDFLEFTNGRPLPLTDRAKAVFHMSILNDTLFLSIINVLDYSILVGIDEEKMELVVGIIDFMRQYDILKQMERVGKSLPMVVGSEAPTIIQPPLYKARFTNAMERYFMTVPSKWTTI